LAAIHTGGTILKAAIPEAIEETGEATAKPQETTERT
jgi:hypothetical protein